MMNVGLIGCGMVSKIHMKAYKAMDNVKVVAICDMDAKRANSFAQSYGIEKVFTNNFDLFALKDLAYVDVCTPTSTHETVVRDAAKSGVNVLMEKPMGRNSQECDRMIEEARKHGTKLCVCHNQLFFPHVQYLKSLADSPGFNLMSFRTSHRENFEWLKAHKLAQPWNVLPEHGGILWEVGTHLAYLHLHFLNNITEVYAIGAKEKYSVYDDFIVLLRTSSGPWGIFEINWIAKEAEIVYEIIGSAGQRYQTYLPHGYIIERMKDSPADLKTVLGNYSSDEARLYKKWSTFAKHQIKRPNLGHFNLISAYAESLRNDTRSPVTGEDGRNAIRLLECIQKSLDEKTPVAFSSI